MEKPVFRGSLGDRGLKLTLVIFSRRLSRRGKNTKAQKIQSRVSWHSGRSKQRHRHQLACLL